MLTRFTSINKDSKSLRSVRFRNSAAVGRHTHIPVGRCTGGYVRRREGGRILGQPEESLQESHCDGRLSRRIDDSAGHGDVRKKYAAHHAGKLGSGGRALGGDFAECWQRYKEYNSKHVKYEAGTRSTDVLKNLHYLTKIFQFL